jgi:CRP/FNR family transcriptional regulator, cyclic AMP receptor protein
MNSFWPSHKTSPEHPEKVDATVGFAAERDEHLRRVSLFGECTEEDLRRIAEISRVVEGPAGTVMTRAGGPGDSFFLIMDGRVSVETPVGLTDPLQAGDFFGEMSLIDGEPRSATITALTDVRLLVVDRTHFWRLLDEAPNLLRRILVVLSRRVRRLEQVANTLRQRMNQT